MATSNGTMKMEGDFDIKMDPDVASPSLADIDEYEDTGELVIPKKVRSAFGQADARPEAPGGWLLRIPKELWQGLANLPGDMDDEIQIGNIKAWGDLNKYRFELKPNIPGWDMIPKQYDMTPQPAQAKNTFVFSEKNLPGFRSRNGGYRGANSQGVDSKGGPVKVEKPRQRGPRTIPKHTEMLGHAKVEFTCTPRDTEEYRRIQTIKTEATKKKQGAKLTLLSGSEATALVRGGMTDATTFSTTAPEKKKRTQDNKATRMPETQLIDQLTVLFREFKYWPIASLKRRLNQPEAYLREVLGKIGMLVKTGQAANTWALSENYVNTLKFTEGFHGVKDEGDAAGVKAEDVAPIKMEDGDGDLDMDDDDDDDDDEDDFVEA